MSKFFMYDSELQELEQLMMLAPNFVPRASGMVVVHGFVKEDPHQAQVTEYVGDVGHLEPLSLDTFDADS